MRPMDAETPRFAESDLFLQVLVGLVSVTARVESFFERAAPFVPGEGADPDEDDTVLFALLGVVSLQRNIRSALETAMESASSSEPSPGELATSNPPLPPDLLR